jgi:hypothetical protein
LAAPRGLCSSDSYAALLRPECQLAGPRPHPVGRFVVAPDVPGAPQASAGPEALLDAQEGFTITLIASRSFIAR